MIVSIVSTGMAIGCIYALIGITYNVMFSASRVFSFTAGTLGMLGGVLGSLFIAQMGVPLVAGFFLVLAAGAVFGIITEIVAVRPVLKSLDQHLYVLSTLALALIVQQFTAIEWGTESRPFPRLFDIARGGFDQQFWLPMLACAVVIGARPSATNSATATSRTRRLILDTITLLCAMQCWTPRATLSPARPP